MMRKIGLGRLLLIVLLNLLKNHIELINKKSFKIKNNNFQKNCYKKIK